MIDRQRGCIIIECDACDETFEGDKGDDFDAVWPVARDAGWKARQIGSEWVHTCPDCGGRS